jgi:hypothetical protein
LFRITEGLGLIARAGLLLFAPITSDRAHHVAANGCDSLRKRSAGTAAEMFLRNGHWNELQPTHCSLRAKREFFSPREDCVTEPGEAACTDERCNDDDR